MELKIDNLTKNYGNKIAVNSFSCVLTSGIYGLLGANGSGKTTLMRMLCDIIKPTSGTITVDGTSIKVMDESYRELLGYLPQNFGYYPNFTGWEFMMYLAALKGLPKIMATERCEQLLRTVGLFDVKNKKLKTYSGGMRQRIGIAQALINDPKILILDEPTAGLDPKERAKFRNIISDLSGERIILLSTHIVSDIEFIADDILVMKEGELVLFDKHDTICNMIDDSVWLCKLPDKMARELISKHVVSNLRHIDGEIEVRIVSKDKPCDIAEHVAPNLEDLYLYFFKEEVSNDTD